MIIFIGLIVKAVSKIVKKGVESFTDAVKRGNSPSKAIQEAFRAASQQYHCPLEYTAQNPRQSFLVVGHRGSPNKQPENTIESCQQALDDGANAVEIDLCLTADHHVILWHDWEPGGLFSVPWLRRTGLEPSGAYMPLIPADSRWKRPTDELTLDEFRTHYGYMRKIIAGNIYRSGFPSLWDYAFKSPGKIPTFQEFAQWASGRDNLDCVVLDVKIPPEKADKAPQLIRSVKESLRTSGAEGDFDVVFISPERQVVQRMKMPDTPAQVSWDAEIKELFVATPSKFSGVARAIEMNNPVASVGRPVLTVRPWTVYRSVVEYDLRRRDQHNASVSDITVGFEGPPKQRVKTLLGWTINDPREMDCLVRMGVDGLLTDNPGRLQTVATNNGKSVGTTPPIG